MQELASFILIAADISSIVSNNFFYVLYRFLILKQYRHHCNEHCTTDERRTNHSIVARRRTTRFLARTILDPGKSIQVRRHRIPHDKDSPGQKVCRGWGQHRVGSRGEGTGCTSLRPSPVQFVQATRHAVTSCTFARAYIRTHAAGVRCVRSQIPKTSVLLGHT